MNEQFTRNVSQRNYGAETDYRVQYSMDVYESVLSNVDDGSVTVVSIGYPQDLY